MLSYILGICVDLSALVFAQKFFQRNRHVPYHTKVHNVLAEQIVWGELNIVDVNVSPAFVLVPVNLAVSGKRRQGQALSGRYAGLDRARLAPGCKILRARDEDASGGGSRHG